MAVAQNFEKRLQKIIEYYELSASAFSEKIGVQRSAISHLLAGRNKPSLDVILKITEAFSEIDLYWLLMGKGTFPGPSENLSKSQNQKTEEDYPKQKLNPKLMTKNKNLKKNHSIDRIIIFYKDGSFDEYQN